MKNLFILLFCLTGNMVSAQERGTNIIPSHIQIKTAVLPLPEEQRDGAMVYGYDKTGKMVVLRQGNNNMVCLADDPNRKGINVSCYSKKLDAFMARGRELAAEGKSVAEQRETRRMEAEAGDLVLPDSPSMTYILSGDEEDYNSSTGELENGHLRYVIYMPFATTEETGLPDKPHAPGMPWLMDPGTHRAHIMITPPKN